jgi:hypothetical protein
MWELTLELRFGRPEFGQSTTARGLIMSKDFEEEIGRIFGEYEDTKATREGAAAQEAQDRQEFLKLFRDKLQNVILPTFKSLEDNTSVMLSDVDLEAVSDPGGHRAELRLSDAKEKKYSLVFNADFQRKRVTVAKGEPGYALLRPHLILEAGEISEDLVHAEIKAFLRENLKLNHT